MHAGDEVETRFEAREQARDPVGLEDAARVGDADDQGAGAFRMRLARRQPRQSGRDRGALAGELADAELARPVAQPEGGLGVAALGDVTEKK